MITYFAGFSVVAVQLPSWLGELRGRRCIPAVLLPPNAPLPFISSQHEELALPLSFLTVRARHLLCCRPRVPSAVAAASATRDRAVSPVVFLFYGCSKLPHAAITVVSSGLVGRGTALFSHRRTINGAGGQQRAGQDGALSGCGHVGPRPDHAPHHELF